MIDLTTTEPVPDRAFAHPEHSRRESEVMNRMLDRLRAHVGRVGSRLQNGPRRDVFADDDGKHLIVLPHPGLVSASGELTAVGFFGQARADVDHTPILDLEDALVQDMPSNLGLVAYYNVRWWHNGWGNLVLFLDDEAKDGWGSDQRHREAVELSPRHYHSIRLHNGMLPGGLVGHDAIDLVRTKYLDFDRPWRAVRHLRAGGGGRRPT